MRTPKHQVGDYFSTEARLGEGLKNIRVLRHNDVACNLTGPFNIKLGTEYASPARASDS